MSNPYKPETSLPTQIVRPLEENIINVDPSEAVDSAAILPAIQEVFPKINIWPTGGAIFRTVLTHLIHNFDEAKETDRALLEMIALIDQNCGETHLACALSRL